jgi:enoyl-CoA hydratase/carnithine racemase
VSQFQTIVYEKEAGIGRITLNRPHLLNAYNVQMRDELYQVLGAIKDDSEVKVAMLCGAGERAFCAGADLSEFLTAPSPVIARQVRWERDVWGLFLSLPQPIIAALHGFVLGSGIEMALCCDIRIASDDAQFGLPEMSLGLIPAAGATQTLPRIVGRAASLEMLLANRWLKAQEACDLGLISRVVSRPQLMAVVEELAQKLAGYDQRLLRAAKEAVLRGLDLSLEEGLELERRLAGRLFQKPAAAR